MSGMCPIIGVRYHLEGQDYDLCEAEYIKLPQEKQAQFVAIKEPAKARFFRPRHEGAAEKLATENDVSAAAEDDVNATATQVEKESPDHTNTAEDPTAANERPEDSLESIPGRNDIGQKDCEVEDAAVSGRGSDATQQMQPETRSVEDPPPAYEPPFTSQAPVIESDDELVVISTLRDADDCAHTRALAISALGSMGFTDEAECHRLLDQHGTLEKVVEALVDKK